MDDVLTTLRLRASELSVTNANEAMTRFKLVDDIIFQLLGWTKEDAQIEETVHGGDNIEFIDYVLSTGRHSILIEAKRIGAAFQGLPGSRKSFLKGAWMRKPIGKVILQAREYAWKKGVGFCIVTSGTSWLAFPVNRRDQVSFEESSCLIFRDIDSVLDDSASEFVSLFSRQSVISGSLDKSLLGSERDQNEPRRLNNIYDRSFSRINRKSIFSYIEHEIITAFNEELLSDNAELLQKCYVTTPERTRFDTRIQMYLAPREQVLKTSPIKPMSRKDRKSVQLLLRETKLTSRPIALLTVGLVGCGKTTFLHYTAAVSAKDLFAAKDGRSNAYWVYVDFRNFSKSMAPRTYLTSGIFEFIKQNPYLKDYERCVKKAYSAEIDALTTGPLSPMAADDAFLRQQISHLLMEDYKAKDPYVAKIMSFISKERPVFLVVDNVDQIEDNSIQSEIFLEATALARSIGSNLVLAMRDATYVKNRSSAVFDAFDFDAVYIEPPNILAVLARRFTVAEQLLKGKKISFAAHGGPKVIVVNDARLIVTMLSQSVLGTEVGRIIEVAATGDTRLALQMTRQFLQYGYTSTAKAVETYQREGRYQLPPHEALRAIMLGNQSVYREDFSVFGNPFDARLGRSDLQMLRVYLMYVLVSYSSQREFEGISAKDVIENLERIGVSEASGSQVLKDLIKWRYCFARSHQEYTRESIIIPSRLCGYVVHELIGRLIFVETVMFDTFIGDETIWDAIKENMKIVYRERNPINKLAVRREVAALFFDFLEDRLERTVSEARVRGLSPQWCVNALTKARDSFHEDLSRAARSADRNYGPRQGSDVEKLPLFETGSFRLD